MIRSIWLNAWDIAGRAPSAVIDELRFLGLNACHLALSYHGGRMLLPRHPMSVVYEQNPGAVYFRANVCQFGRLKPSIADEAEAVESFLDECRTQRFPVYAWTVLCHNDAVDDATDDSCIKNAFGDRYRYAFCPAHPDVAIYARKLCGQIKKISAIEAIDLEALSFLGYPHQSLHDKRGAFLGAEAEWLLSLCFCEHCCNELGDDAQSIRSCVQRRVRYLLNHRPAEAIDLVTLESAGIPAKRITDSRKAILLRLLSQLPQESILLRISNDYWFNGGKAQLKITDLPSQVKAVTLTFFGSKPERIAEHLKEVSRHPPAFAGMSILQPQIETPAELANAVSALRNLPLAGLVFYHYGLANETQLNWLQKALRS